MSPSAPDSADIYIQLTGATAAPRSVVDLGEGPLSPATAPPLGQLSHRSLAVPLQLAQVLVEDFCRAQRRHQVIELPAYFLCGSAPLGPPLSLPLLLQLEHTGSRKLVGGKGRWDYEWSGG